MCLSDEYNEKSYIKSYINPGHQQKPVFNHTSRMVYLRLNVLVSRRAAENAELASRFALAVGLAEC